MSKKGYAALESELQRQAYQWGLASLPYPQRFRGICGALRPLGFVVVPNGDIHKCWDTVSMPHMKVGSIFNLDALNTDERLHTWMRWTPFENETCRSCKILPNCAGSCAHKFINPGQTTGEGGSLPCPSWKYQIKERLVLQAKQSGMITPEDYNVEGITTDPSEICAVAPLAFLGVEARRDRVARRLPVLGGV